MNPVGSQPFGDDDVPPRPLRRQDALRFFDKGAHEEDPIDEEEEDEEDADEQPDLGEYFSQWDISPKEQILMCRSYASYLSVLKAPFKHSEKK